MLKNILTTSSVRLISALLGLLVTTLNARFLGADGLGVVRIFTVTVTLLMLLANFVGGPHLVYHTSRIGLSGLWLRSYLWCLFIVTIFILVGFIPGASFDFHIWIACCALFHAFAWVNVYLLLGKERVWQQNVVVISFHLCLFIGVLLLYLVFHVENPVFYVYLYVFATFTMWVVGLLFLKKQVRLTSLTKDKQVFKTLLSDGAYVQSGNFFQQINYRIGDYLIDAFWGKAAVGVFGLAIQLSEGVWTVAKSAALVQYSRLSNIYDQVRAKKITYQMSKAIVVVTFFGFLVISLLPLSFYEYFFTSDFNEVRRLIRFLAPAFTVYSAGFIFSNYFSSSGKFKYNTLSSLAGTIIALISGVIFIPIMGIEGAVITASVTHLMSIAAFIYFLKREENRADRWMLVSMKDWRWLRYVIKRR